MPLQTTLNLLDALYQNTDPISGEKLPNNSIFQHSSVRYAVANLRSTLRNAHNEMKTEKVTPELLASLTQILAELGYPKNATQMLHICRGSRRVVDPKLRSLAIFGRFRGQYSKVELKKQIDTFLAQEGSSKITEHPWEAEPFFSETPFDRLNASNALKLQQEIWELGLRKPTEKLPAFQGKARQRYPRAYEPWTKAEKALLLEGMCYTNQLQVLSPIFGRGEQSLKKVGQRLIWESRQRKR